MGAGPPGTESAVSPGPGLALSASAARAGERGSAQPLAPDVSGLSSAGVVLAGLGVSSTRFLRGLVMIVSLQRR
ncbi:hypothetical protein D3C71_1897400 [compost metagenome]